MTSAAATEPISPDTEHGSGRAELPAYVANGIIGLRVREVPLIAGMALVNAFVGEHPVRRIEAAALAPYPCAGDLQIDGVHLSDAPQQISDMTQDYDFSCGELTSRFTFTVGKIHARVEVLTFCDRAEPTLVCQEIRLEVSAACDVGLATGLAAGAVDGRAMRFFRETPGEATPACDGALLWESAGGLARCGLAYVTDLGGAVAGAEPERAPLAGGNLMSRYAFRASANHAYRLRHIASLVPSQMHHQPDHEAVRLAALAKRKGFEAIRAGNRAVWADLWRGRIRLVGAPRRWQAMADAACFYLLSSTHSASPASTSIFGLATWRDYHYYYGHVMWDIETFIAPVLGLLQPGAAQSLLAYRFRNLAAAASNAQLRGRRGLQFPWESSPSTGDECAPMPGSAAWHEDHVSLDVALAFAFHAAVTGDDEFLRTRAWPVLSGVARWLQSRVTKSERGYEIRAAMGIAERQTEADNPAFTNMSAVCVLRAAIAVAGRLGLPIDPAWSRIAEAMAMPMRGKVIVSHDGFRIDEEKGATPDPLMGVFPLGFPMDPEIEEATLRFYLPRADQYLGSPMLSALYGVWAARLGDRPLAARMLEDGYGRFCVGRFMQTLEYRGDVFPEQPRAGPFFANLGGFLASLVLGFPGLDPSGDDPDAWACRPVVLPEGWDAIEIDRLWIGGRPAALRARHGAAKAELTFTEPS